MSSHQQHTSLEQRFLEIQKSLFLDTLQGTSHLDPSKYLLTTSMGDEDNGDGDCRDKYEPRYRFAGLDGEGI